MTPKKGALACIVCGQRNYSIKPTQTGKITRLEVKKYCRYCNQHTVHKETK